MMPGSFTRSVRLAGTVATLVTVAMLTSGCGEDPVAPGQGQRLTLSLQNVSGVHPDQGTFEVWVHSGVDTVSVGRLPSSLTEAPIESFGFTVPLDRPAGVFITLESPDDSDPRPSHSVFLKGTFSGSRADLALEGAITDGRPLQPEPGAHSLFTTSNNAELGYPSAEAAGLWLFTLIPSQNAHGTREVHLTPLNPGWTYEGWIVSQTSPEVWIPYGKFTPDELGLLSSRDDTGTGPFSGAQDYRNAGVEDVPGEEWTSSSVSDLLGLQLPAGLTIPLLLDGEDDAGNAMWRHVITVEPSFDLAEGPLAGRPFITRPYQNDIGSAGPGVPRRILLMTERLPSAQVIEAPSD